MTNIKEEFEKWADVTIFSPIDISDVYKAYQTAHEAQQKRIDKLEILLSEQLLIIKGFTLECEDMGTTDIITALSRKDTKITALEADINTYVKIANDNADIIHTLEARCKELERLSTLGVKTLDELNDELIEKLTLLEARCKELESALKLAQRSHEVILTSYPGHDAWVYNKVDEVIRDVFEKYDTQD